MENATEINFAHNHADFTNFMQIPDGLLHPVCIINGYILPKLISVGKCQGNSIYFLKKMRRNAIMSKGDEDGDQEITGRNKDSRGSSA